MAISKEKKKELLAKYVEHLKSAHNAVVLQQNSIDVNTTNDIRKWVKLSNGKYTIVRKRLFLLALKEAGLPELAIGDLPWSLVLLTSEDQENEFGPLKVVNNVVKKLKKDDSGSSYVFLWWWFDKIWKDGDYVNELANVPSREELISKLLYMLKYPMQALVSVVDQIAKQSPDSVNASWYVASDESKEPVKDELEPEVASDNQAESIPEEVKEEVESVAPASEKQEASEA